MLFNIYLNDLFYFVDKCNNANYADDTKIDSLLNSMETETNTLITWFNDKNLTFNADKCHLLISKHNKDNTLMSKKRLLNAVIDTNLNFKDHVSNLCRKANQKLHALATISNFTSKGILRILMKAFVESQFGYFPLLGCSTVEQ